LNFPEQQVFCGGIHVMVFVEQGWNAKSPCRDLPSRGCLNEECESPGRAVVRPQSRKGRSGWEEQWQDITERNK